MEPTLYSGDKIWCVRSVTKQKQTSRWIGKLVVVKTPEGIAVKRIRKIKDNTLWLIGDNETRSTDSRDYGWISVEAIIGWPWYRYESAKTQRTGLIR